MKKRKEKKYGVAIRYVRSRVPYVKRRMMANRGDREAKWQRLALSTLVDRKKKKKKKRKKRRMEEYRI